MFVLRRTPQKVVLFFYQICWWAVSVWHDKFFHPPSFCFCRIQAGLFAKALICTIIATHTMVGVHPKKPRNWSVQSWGYARNLCEREPFLKLDQRRGIREPVLFEAQVRILEFLAEFMGKIKHTKKRFNQIWFIRWIFLGGCSSVSDCWTYDLFLVRIRGCWSGSQRTVSSFPWDVVLNAVIWTFKIKWQVFTAEMV